MSIEQILEMAVGEGKKSYRYALRYDIAVSEHVSLLTLPSDGIERQMQ